MTVEHEVRRDDQRNRYELVLDGEVVGIADFERRWAGLQAHNRWLVDFCSDAPDRARGLIQLLPNDVEAAVDEMEWASSRSVFGNVTWRKLARLRPVAPWGAGRLRP
jgi:predicted TIM-barrel fold metal-dependent hydrolase